MAEMRYMGVDLLTRQVVEDLPLYGVSLGRRISTAGNMTASFKLGTKVFDDDDLLNATAPGLRALYVLRDDFCIWAGPIWSRTYQSQASVCSLTGQTYESVFSQIKMLSRFKRVNTDQTIIFKDLIDMMEAQPSSDFGFDTSEITASDVNVDSMTVEVFEHRMFSEAVDELLKLSGSFDYTIDHTVQSDGSIALKVKTGYPYLGFGQAGIDLDYPGSITNYWFPESAGKGAVNQTVIGAGEGSAMPVAEYSHTDLLQAGYPAWANVHAEKGVRNRTALARIAAEEGRKNKMPVSIPTIEFNLDEASDDFAQWANLGVPVNAHIQDDRFPDLTFSSRMLGWDYKPSESDNQEELKLVLEGADSAV